MAKAMNKREAAERILRYSSVFVIFDPSKVEQIPDQFKDRKTLSLQFGYNLPIPIPDLALSSQGIGGTLSFSCQPKYCFIPWEFVTAVLDDKSWGVAWNQELHKDLPEQKQKPQLRLIKGGKR